MKFSFEKIQDLFYQELLLSGSNYYNPFYIDEHYFKNIEIQLNELIKNSKYCSVLIRSSIDNGICEVLAFYNKDNELKLCLWKYNGVQKEVTIQDSNAKKILKSIPEHEILIDKSNVPISGGTTKYIIKKIKNKTYYYANIQGNINVNYMKLMDLFQKYY